VTPEASLKYWSPGSISSDRPLIGFLDRYVQEGARVWDIGANVGVAAFYSAARVKSTGIVLAVESDPFLSSLLLRSVQELDEIDGKTMILTVAVSDKIGLEEFAVPVRSRASNFVIETGGCSQAGGVRFSFKVVCVTLDWILANTFAPDVVKLDIEGMEARVLTAAPNLLGKVRPVLHIEVWDSIADELTALLHKNDYVLRDGEKEGYPAVSRATWCTVAIPRERMSD
jgi:FkbM family methyltransferase